MAVATASTGFDPTQKPMFNIMQCITLDKSVNVNMNTILSKVIKLRVPKMILKCLNVMSVCGPAGGGPEGDY